MTPLSDLLQQGGAHGWLFIPTAIALGALHGLEPGHSKTMMAAFIVAVRGTVGQAVLLGLAATLSHTAVVWAVALAGMYFGAQFGGETSEPYFQIVSGCVMMFVALWMFWQMRAGEADHKHHHGGHDHDHHGHEHGHDHDHDVVDDVVGYADAHERAHAQQIEKQFAGRSATTGQIIVFGLTGGLIPCPAAITVLLLCLQLKKFTLGVALVLCFSVGLALTLVAAGVLAALAVRHVGAHMREGGRFSQLARRAPYLSIALIACIGFYVLWQGVGALL